jgi:multisubunit Na+/H+ antiporter MnhF subunit
MTTTTRTPRRAARTGSQGLAWLVLAMAVLEVVAPVVTINGPGASPGDGAGEELLITPIGWAFSIWGVIYTLAIAQAVATLVRGPGSVPRRLQVDLTVLYLGGTLWIFMAAADSSLATALALALMLVAALDAVLTTARTAVEPRWFSVLTRSAVGLFAGWVTAAFFLNLSTALVGLDVVQPDDVGWQLVVLAAAAVALLTVLVRTGGIVAYAAAGTWAMLGIAVRGDADGTTSVLVGAVVVGAALVVTTVALAVRRR